MEAFTTKEFEINFKNLYKPLCLFALRFTGNVDDAEDVVQQAFSDVWNKRDTIGKIDNMKSYLFRVVRNHSINNLSKESPEHSSLELPDFADIDQDEQMAIAERDARLWNAIDNLPPERKKIFLMSKRDGLKYKEIADELNLSVKTIENQIGKALKALRDTTINIYNFFFSF